MVSLTLGSCHHSLKLLDTLAHRVDRIIFLFQVGRVIVVEIHINIIEVIRTLLSLLKLRELIQRQFNSLNGGWSKVAAALSLPCAGCYLLIILLDVLIQCHPVLFCLLLCLLLLATLLGCTGICVDNIVDYLPEFLLGDSSIPFERQIKTTPNRIHFGIKVRVSIQIVLANS